MKTLEFRSKEQRAQIAAENRKQLLANQAWWQGMLDLPPDGSDRNGRSRGSDFYKVVRKGLAQAELELRDLEPEQELRAD